VIFVTSFVQSNDLTKPRPQGWFLLMGAISLILTWHPLLKTFLLAWENEAYTHILLIVPISLGLIYMDWPGVRSTLRPGWQAGSIPLVAALTVAEFARWRSESLTVDVQLSIYMLAVVLWWIGVFIACFGTRVSKGVLFPLCFLFWLVPLPAFLIGDIVRLLQQGSAYAAHWLFSAAGVPVTQDGIQITIPDLTVEVAQECSSIRSSMILIVTTMVLAQLFLRSPWRKALVMILAIPLSIAKNGLRIFTIAMLGTRVDPGYLTGRFHHNGGAAFLAIAVGVIFLLLWILREDRSGQLQGVPTSAISPAPK
jgi:exosortase